MSAKPPMTITLNKWTFTDKESLMALCNAVDRTILSDRHPNPYADTDDDWWLGMIAERRKEQSVQRCWPGSRGWGRSEKVAEIYPAAKSQQIEYQVFMFLGRGTPR